MATPRGVEYPARRIEDVERAEPKMALEIERPLLSAVVERSMRVSWSSIAPSCALAAAGSG